MENNENDIDIQFANSLTNNQDIKYFLKKHSIKDLKDLIM